MQSHAHFLETVLSSTLTRIEQSTPEELVLVTLAGVVLTHQALNLYQKWDSYQIKTKLTSGFIQGLTHIPILGTWVKQGIQGEVDKNLAAVKRDIIKARQGLDTYETLPQVGLSSKKILDRLKPLQDHYRPGKLSGAVYTRFEPDLAQTLQAVWLQTALTNPMHSEWPLINHMEAEIFSMCQALQRGDQGAPGLLTHGGSFSIFEACKAYVLEARRRGIRNPEIIAPSSVHVAFDKAAETLNVRLVKISVDPKTGAADIKATERAINSNTCLLVGSAPSFPFGIIDPIEALGELALDNDLGLHVDNCLGGFLTPFAREAGFDIPACDFSVPGVTSISMDTHKYGQTPKGSSVLLFSKQTKATPAHVHLGWVGGMYATPNLDGSRAGADIAITWTVLAYHGRQFYVNATRDLLNLQHLLVRELRAIPEVIVPHDPRLSVIPIQTRPGINALAVAMQMQDCGQAVNILQTPQQTPAGFHMCLTAEHVASPNFVAEFIAYVKASVAYVKAHPKEPARGMAKTYGALAKGVPDFIQQQIGEGYLRLMGTLPSLWSQTAKPKTQVRPVPAILKKLGR